MEINKITEHLKNALINENDETKDFYSKKILDSIVLNLLDENLQPNRDIKSLKCYGLTIAVSPNNHITVVFPDKTVNLTTGKIIVHKQKGGM